MQLKFITCLIQVGRVKAKQPVLGGSALIVYRLLMIRGHQEFYRVEVCPLTGNKTIDALTAGKRLRASVTALT